MARKKEISPCKSPPFCAMIKAAPHLDHEEMLTMNLKLNNKRTILVGLCVPFHLRLLADV